MVYFRAGHVYFATAGVLRAFWTDGCRRSVRKNRQFPLERQGDTARNGRRKPTPPTIRATSRFSFASRAR